MSLSAASAITAWKITVWNELRSLTVWKICCSRSLTAPRHRVTECYHQRLLQSRQDLQKPCDQSPRWSAAWRCAVKQTATATAEPQQAWPCFLCNPLQLLAFD
jgi:hypothetical protein